VDRGEAHQTTATPVDIMLALPRRKRSRWHAVMTATRGAQSQAEKAAVRRGATIQQSTTKLKAMTRRRRDSRGSRDR